MTCYMCIAGRKIARAALRAGADPNAQNKQGQTALHYALSYGYFELAEYIQSKGADPGLRNLNGKTPYDGVASSSGAAGAIGKEKGRKLPPL
mmetsp:Transcript_10458/g.33813  ORF Transcript_10458/g.33813 Transcript_10458/m.33813 type:complete len:92 (-) Transcript_10458:124-399(-)